MPETLRQLVQKHAGAHHGKRYAGIDQLLKSMNEGIEKRNRAEYTYGLQPTPDNKRAYLEAQVLCLRAEHDWMKSRGMETSGVKRRIEQMKQTLEVEYPAEG